MKNKQRILESYLECALWTEEKDTNNISDFGASSITQAKKDIESFMNEAEPLLSEWSEEQIGYDFWLTRNGHGAGFWDRDLPNGKELTKICENFKGVDVWESELGIIYFES